MSIASTNADIFQELDRQNADFMSEAQRLRRKHYKSPYTDAMLKKIEESGLEPIYVNIIKPHVKTLVGMMYSNKNSVTAIPNNSESKYAYIWQALITAFLQVNNWPTIYRRVLTDQMISGIGFAQIDIDDGFNPNPFGARIKYMDFEKCRWSTNYTHPLMDDLDVFAYYDILTVKSAIVRSGKKYDPQMINSIQSEIVSLPESLKNISVFGGLSEVTKKNENKLVPWIETYRKDWVGYQKLIFYDKDKTKIARSEMIPIGKDKSGKELGGYENVMSYFYTEDDEGKLAKSKVEDIKALGKLKHLDVQRVVKSVSVGGHDIGEYTLPTNMFPFVPFVYDMQEGGYPEGAVKDIESINVALNQTVLLSILNARLQCNFHIIAPTGSIKDMDAFEMQWSKVGSVIEADPVTVGNSTQALMPQPVYAQPLPSTFSDMMQMLIRMAEYSSSVTEALQGRVTGEKPSGVAMEQMQSFGGLKFVPHAETNQASIARLGKVAVDYIKEYSGYDTIIRYKEQDSELADQISVEPNEGMNPAAMNSRINDSMTAVGQKVSYPGYNMEMPLNYRVQTPEGMKIVNDIKNAEADVDFIITATPSTDTARQNWLAILENWMRQYPASAEVVGEEALKLSNYPGAEKLAAKINTVKSLRSELENAQSVIEKLKGEQVNLMQQNVRTKMSSDVTKVTADYRMKLDKLFNDFKLAVDTMKAGGGEEGENKGADQFEKVMGDLEAMVAEQAQSATPETTQETVESTTPKG